MIVFDLICEDGHVFEGWFGSSDDFEGQKSRGLIQCPMCGSAEVGKAVMAPRVAAKGNQRRDLPVPASTTESPVPMASGETSTATMKAMMRALAEAQRRALENSDYVGGRFAEEARAIHEGESEERPIHGHATAEEAKSLIDDGVRVAPLPFPVRPPGRDN